MQELAELLDRRRRAVQDLDRLVDHRPHAVQLALAPAHVGDLVLRDLGGDPRQAGEAEHQVALQLVDAAPRDDHRRDLEPAAALELDPVEAAERRRDLVLRADVLLDQVLLDVDRVLGELVLGDQPPLHRRRARAPGRP